MTDDLDTELSELFDRASIVPGSAAFTASVMAGVSRRPAPWRRRLGLLAGVAALAAVIALLPLQGSFALWSHMVTAPLIDLPPGLVSVLVGPINNSTFPLGLVILALWASIRRLTS